MSAELLLMETSVTQRPLANDEPLKQSIAILIVCYNGMGFLETCIGSLLDCDCDGVQVSLWIIDNASTDNSVQWLKEHFGTRGYKYGNSQVSIRIVESSENLGFAGANNQLWELVKVHEPQTQFVYLLNQDTEVDPRFLRESLRFMRSHPSIGCAQSLLMLSPEKQLINTAGNASTF